MPFSMFFLTCVYLVFISFFSGLQFVIVSLTFVYVATYKVKKDIHTVSIITKPQNFQHDFT